MGFPVGYSELLLPKLLLNALSLLTVLRKLISWICRCLGLNDFLDSSNPQIERPVISPVFPSVSAILIREILPVVRFEELTDAFHASESCAVCLYEFEGREEIRRLANCCHIFHRSCLDRWMDHDQKTCPLCRTPLVPEDLQDAFNERLWAAAGISDFLGEYSGLSS
ncbi:hypothetical protein AMTRI_Chr09g16180 [Amborella trichopoda]